MTDTLSPISRSAQFVGADLGTVLLVSPFYRPSIGGVVEVADRLLRLLNGLGIETHLLVTWTDGPYGKIVPDGRVFRVWRLPVASSIFHEVGVRSIVGTLGRGVPLLWILWRFVRRKNIRTVVLIYPIDSAWPFLFLSKILRLRLVASLHGTDVWRDEAWSSLYRWLIKSVLRQANAITVPAIHLAVKAREITGDPALTVRLIPNCVDTNYYVPNPSKTRHEGAPFTLLHVSNFAPKKRVLDILKAFSLVAVQHSCRLVLVGSGFEFERAKIYAAALGVDSKVTFCDKQSEIRPFLWEADLFVMASDEESGPIALLEAMACGLPFVSTGWGIAATLPSGECGILVPNRSPEELAEAFVSLIKDPERRERLGRYGRKWAETNFNEALYLQRHLEVLR